jgi:hypothetical protein
LGGRVFDRLLEFARQSKIQSRLAFGLRHDALLAGGGDFVGLV